jgi:hypothetical protein
VLEILCQFFNLQNNAAWKIAGAIIDSNFDLVKTSPCGWRSAVCAAAAAFEPRWFLSGPLNSADKKAPLIEAL